LYAAKIEKAEAEVDWSRSAAEVDQHIRGLSPFPGAWTLMDEARVKLLMSAVADGSGDAGVVLNDALRVACGAGAVDLVRLQRAGKKAMDLDGFLQGFPVGAGARLGGSAQ
jgi:methionyl-tRNA formyltransferase